MSDLIRREDAYAAIRGLTRHIDRIAAITALPAVQPDARIKEYEEAYQYALHLAEALRENYPPNPDFQFLGGLVGLLTQIDNMVAGLSQPAVQSDAAVLRERERCAKVASGVAWWEAGDTAAMIRKGESND